MIIHYSTEVEQSSVLVSHRPSMYLLYSICVVSLYVIKKGYLLSVLTNAEKHHHRGLKLTFICLFLCILTIFISSLYYAHQFVTPHRKLHLGAQCHRDIYNGTQLHRDTYDGTQWHSMGEFGSMSQTNDLRQRAEIIGLLTSHQMAHCTWLNLPD